MERTKIRGEGAFERAASSGGPWMGLELRLKAQPFSFLLYISRGGPEMLSEAQPLSKDHVLSDVNI